MTFTSIIEKIIQKYPNQFLEHDEMLSIETINKFDVNSDIVKLGLYINTLINIRFNYETNKINIPEISYEQYFKDKKNGQFGYSYQTDIQNIIDRLSIFQVFELLSEEQRKILILKYGLFDNSQLTYSSIGDLSKVSKQAIQFQEKESMKKLKRKHIIEILKN